MCVFFWCLWYLGPTTHLQILWHSKFTVGVNLSVNERYLCCMCLARCSWPFNSCPMGLQCHQKSEQDKVVMDYIISEVTELPTLPIYISLPFMTNVWAFNVVRANHLASVQMIWLNFFLRCVRVLCCSLVSGICEIICGGAGVKMWERP